MDRLGVNPILPTPFSEAGEVDVGSLERLIDFQAAAGVDGVAILGFLGKAHKLSEAERRTAIETVVARAAGRFPVWVGVRSLGGQYYLEELARGTVGIMAGFAFPEVLVEIYRKFTSGDLPGAARAFDHYLPLIRYEFQPTTGLAFRKHVYVRRGVFTSAFIRPPGMSLDDTSRHELEGIIARVGLNLDAPGMSDASHVDEGERGVVANRPLTMRKMSGAGNHGLASGDSRPRRAVASRGRQAGRTPPEPQHRNRPPTPPRCDRPHVA